MLRAMSTWPLVMAVSAVSLVRRMGVAENFHDLSGLVILAVVALIVLAVRASAKPN